MTDPRRDEYREAMKFLAGLKSNDTPKKSAQGGGEVLLRCTVLVAGTIIKRLKTCPSP